MGIPLDRNNASTPVEVGVALSESAMDGLPGGVYTLPHFDFHFYTVPASVRDGIMPTDPQYAA